MGNDISTNWFSLIFSETHSIRISDNLYTYDAMDHNQAIQMCGPVAYCRIVSFSRALPLLYLVRKHDSNAKFFWHTSKLSQESVKCMMMMNGGMEHIRHHKKIKMRQLVCFSSVCMIPYDYLLC